MPELDKVIDKVSHEIARGQYIDSDYVDIVEVSLLNDVLALLKAQRPRVLTLEELISIGKSWNSNTAPYLWSEILNAPEWYTDNPMWVPYNFIHDTISIGSEDYNKHNYMKRWRCWNIKPTDEQRQAVKWND